MVNLILMGKGREELARGLIPELGAVIRARRQDPSTVRTKSRILDATLMVKGRDELPRSRIPELGGVVPACGQNPSTIRAKGPVRDFILMIKRADALCELVASTGGEAPRTQVVVHVDSEALAADNGVGELQGGPNVAMETVKRLSCDSSMQTVVDDKDGKPVSSFKSRRYPTARQRRDLARRDQGCRWPGCRRKKVVEAHHIQHHKSGGETELYNLVLMCKLHHYLVHEAGYVVIGQPPNIQIKGPHGELIRNGPPPMAAKAEELFRNEHKVDVERDKGGGQPRGPDDRGPPGRISAG